MYFTFEVEAEIVFCFLNSLQNMSVSAFVYKVTQNWCLSTRLNGQVVPVRTACLKPAGTKRAGVDPRDELGFWCGESEHLYGHPVCPEKLGSLGLVVKSLFRPQVSSWFIKFQMEEDKASCLLCLWTRWYFSRPSGPVPPVADVKFEAFFSLFSAASAGVFPLASSPHVPNYLFFIL